MTDEEYEERYKRIQQSWIPTPEVMAEVNARIAEREAEAARAAEARVERVATLISTMGTWDLKALAEAVIADVESDAYPVYCPWDCDHCHGWDCPCDRLGCAGSGVELH